MLECYTDTVAEMRSYWRLPVRFWEAVGRTTISIFYIWCYQKWNKWSICAAFMVIENWTGPTKRRKAANEDSNTHAHTHDTMVVCSWSYTAGCKPLQPEHLAQFRKVPCTKSHSTFCSPFRWTPSITTELMTLVGNPWKSNKMGAVFPACCVMLV